MIVCLRRVWFKFERRAKRGDGAGGFVSFSKIASQCIVSCRAWRGQLLSQGRWRHTIRDVTLGEGSGWDNKKEDLEKTYRIRRCMKGGHLQRNSRELKLRFRPSGVALFWLRKGKAILAMHPIYRSADQCGAFAQMRNCQLNGKPRQFVGSRRKEEGRRARNSSS